MEGKKWHIILIKIVIILTILIIGVILYARYIGIKYVFVKEYKITNENLPNEYHGLKIVHFSDIHYKTIINKEELTNIINKINYIKPDIVVFTGDLVDSNVISKLSDDTIKTMNEELTEALKQIKVSIGKYYIKGEDDYSDTSIDIIFDSADFIDLNDTSDLIYNNTNIPISISGISSNINSNININDKIKKLAIENDNSVFKMLILHEPDYLDRIDTSKYNLILAGHSHNGQVRLPFIGAIIKPEGAKKYYDNHYKLNNSDLYVSSGLGTTKINVRLFNHPSINLYRLTNK